MRTKMAGSMPAAHATRADFADIGLAATAPLGPPLACKSVAVSVSVKRGELRLLEPRIPGPGLYSF
jgi:hypothetical protein